MQSALLDKLRALAGQDSIITGVELSRYAIDGRVPECAVFPRSVEDVVAARAPELLSFQNVYVARKPPKARKLSLTVGMLTMNEEDSIEAMMGEIRKVAPDAKILCVDSSTDRTPEIAARLGARVLRQIPPRGHGPAMELLMYSAAAESDLLIYLDCDFTYPAEYIPVLRKLVKKAVDALVREAGADLGNGSELSVVFSDDAHIRSLNAGWRG